MNIKKYLPIAAIVVAVVVVIFFNRSCGQADIKTLKEEHEQAIAKIKKEKQQIEHDREKDIGKIETLRVKIQDGIKERVEREKKIIDLEKKIKNIVPPEKPFDDLRRCQDSFNELVADYNNRGSLIIELKLQIKNDTDQNTRYELLSSMYNNVIAGFQKEKDIWQRTDGERIRYIKKIERKKAPVIVVAIGPTVDYRGRFGVSLCVGVNVTGIIRSLL